MHLEIAWIRYSAQAHKKLLRRNLSSEGFAKWKKEVWALAERADAPEFIQKLAPKRSGRHNRLHKVHPPHVETDNLLIYTMELRVEDPGASDHGYPRVSTVACLLLGGKVLLLYGWGPQVFSSKVERGVNQWAKQVLDATPELASNHPRTSSRSLGPVFISTILTSVLTSAFLAYYHYLESKKKQEKEKWREVA